MATYPPPHFPGGYCDPFPFPYTFPVAAPASGSFPAPPAFPYAATYPYPPLASAYTPALGFSLNWPNWPPPDLWSTPSFPSEPTFPTSTSFTPDVDSVRFPPPPPAGTPATAFLHHPDQVLGAPLPIDLSSPMPQLLNTIPTAPIRERCTSQRHTCSRSSDTSSPTPSANHFSKAASHTSASKMQPDIAPPLELHDRETDAFECHATDLLLDGLHSSSNAAMNDAVALACSPLDGLLADVFDRTPEVTSSDPSMLCAAASSSTSSLSSSFGASSVASTLKFASVAATSVLTVSPASSYVAPQVFGEMPTPRFCYENYGYEHPNPTQNSRVHGGSTNLIKQNLDGMPQQYGLDNLSRHSVFRADGTEHSYYALPENFPFERVAREPVFNVYVADTKSCINEFGGVFSGSSEQKPHEDTESSESLEELFSEQLPKYSSKASENVIPSRQPPMSATPTDQTQFQAFESMPNYDVYEKEDSACLNIISDVRDFTLGLQQQEDMRACNYSALKAFDSLVIRSGHFSIEHSMTDLSLPWDPGASTSLASSKAKPPGKLSCVAIVFPKVLTSCKCNQLGTFVQQLRDSCWKVLVTHERRKEWDPGDTELHVLFTTVAGATKLQCTGVYKSTMVQILALKLGARRAPIFESAIMRLCALGWTEANASALFVRALPCSTCTSVVAEMSQNESGFRDEQLAYMPQGTNINSSEWCHSWYNAQNVFIQGLHIHIIQLANCTSRCTYLVPALLPSTKVGELISRCLGSQLHEITNWTSMKYSGMKQMQWDPGVELSEYSWLHILTEWSEMVKPLSCTHSPEVATWQNHMISAYVWDPGALYKSICMLLYTEEKEMGRLMHQQWRLQFNAVQYCHIFQNYNAENYGHQDINFNGIPLWLINFLVP